MNAPDKFLLPDVQASADQRSLAIQHVGVSGMRYPIELRGGDGIVWPTVAVLSMGVALPPAVKGTHMSRFVELIEAQHVPLSVDGMPALLADMLKRLEADSGRIELAFPWFIRKRAPVSGVASLLDYDVVLECEQHEGQARVTLQVTAPVTSLCPCSKQISAYGAHNQRSHISIRAELRDLSLDIETLVRMAEEEASCEVFGLLKRPDEKWVTERAYDNPKFVEDLVRDIALRLQADPRIAAWQVSSENFESIHNHSAYALIKGVNAQP